MNDFTGVLRPCFPPDDPHCEYRGSAVVGGERDIEADYDMPDSFYRLRFYDPASKMRVGEGELRYAGMRLFAGGATIDGAEFAIRGTLLGGATKDGKPLGQGSMERHLLLTFCNPEMPLPEVVSDAAEP